MINSTLSIIIVNFNSYHFLEKCLISLKRNSSSNFNLEIIVVDNASTTDHIDSLTQKFPEVKLIKNRANIGFAKANNVGIKNSKGDYILLLNPDTVIPDNTLKMMIDFMEKKPDTGIATCRVNLPDGKIDDSCHRGFPTPWRAICHFTGVGNLFPYSQLLNGYHLGYKNLNKIHEIESCSGAFMMIRKKAGKQINWLDTDYFWYGEDLDFCYKMKKNGWKVYFVPEAKIIHFKGISSGIKDYSSSLSKATRQTQLASTKARFEVMRIFYRKHYLKQYPKIITSFIFLGIWVKEFFTLFIFRLTKNSYENRN